MSLAVLLVFSAPLEMDILVKINHCSYDNSTGVFTVPPGGDGLYYFSTYLLVIEGESGSFEIVVNDVVFCTNWGR